MAEAQLVTVAVAAVISVDGRLTRHDETDIYEWVSAEDQAHFQALINTHDAIVMGRHTYEAVRHNLKLRSGKLRVVLTSQIPQYADQAVTGQLEFMNLPAQKLIAELRKRGCQQVLVVGGTRMISEFLHGRLADKLYLTIEPRLFGQGQPLTDLPMDMNLKLTDQQSLNDSGTLLLTYQVADQPL